MIVRSARPADAEALKAILRGTFESTWKPQVTEAAAAAFVAEDRPAAYVGERGMSSKWLNAPARWSASSIGMTTSSTPCTSCPPTPAPASARG
jgi:hypothetical protein